MKLIITKPSAIHRYISRYFIPMDARPLDTYSMVWLIINQPPTNTPYKTRGWYKTDVITFPCNKLRIALVPPHPGQYKPVIKWNKQGNVYFSTKSGLHFNIKTQRITNNRISHPTTYNTFSSVFLFFILLHLSSPVFCQRLNYITTLFSHQ